MQVTPQELEIVRLFRDKVYGRKADTALSNSGHDGDKGHWLEDQMGIVRNNKNEPDLLGYEMKTGTSSKISFGDWSPDYFIYNDEKYVPILKGRQFGKIYRRNKYFIRVFGRPNAEKGNRYSWSGTPTPKIDAFNIFGTRLRVTNDFNVEVFYNYSKDTRDDKDEIVPESMRNDNLIIASWSKEKLSSFVNEKFNQAGWFVCKKDKTGTYNKIVFGKPLDFYTWIEMVKNKTAFYDPGVYEGNPRPYSHWRANNVTFDNLIVRSYPNPDLFPID